MIERQQLIVQITEMLEYCDGDILAKINNHIAKIRNTTGSDQTQYPQVKYRGDNTFSTVKN